MLLCKNEDNYDWDSFLSPQAGHARRRAHRPYDHMESEGTVVYEDPPFSNEEEKGSELCILKGRGTWSRASFQYHDGQLNWEPTKIELYEIAFLKKLA